MRERIKVRKRFFPNRNGRRNYYMIQRIINMKNETHKRIIAMDNSNLASLVHSITDNNEKIVFSSYQLKLKVRLNSVYVGTDALTWVSYNKITKKLYSNIKKIDSVYSNFLDIIYLENTRFEWLLAYNNLISKIRTFISKRVFIKILNGRITNYDLLLKAILSEKSIRGVNIKKLLNLLNEDYSSEERLRYFIKCCNLSQDYNKNFNSILELIKGEGKFSRDNNVLIIDSMKMAFNMKSKINFNWSIKRIQQEHDRLTKEIELIKLKGFINRIIRYQSLPKNQPDSIKIIDSTFGFYKESKAMNHCLYSNNYFDSAYNKNIIVISYNDGEYRGTAEISHYNSHKHGCKILHIRQFNGFGNVSMPFEARRRLTSYLNSDDFISWYEIEIMKLDDDSDASKRLVKMEDLEEMGYEEQNHFLYGTKDYHVETEKGKNIIEYYDKIEYHEL